MSVEKKKKKRTRGFTNRKDLEEQPKKREGGRASSGLGYPIHAWVEDQGHEEENKKVLIQ